jgi:endonuclease/exonuclease/phosphatase family metal-dependent hydrolase
LSRAGLSASRLTKIGGDSMPPSPDSDQDAELNVMTFNLRYASAQRPHSWAERRPAMRALLRGESPHLIGTQEGLYQQLRDIEHDLSPGYAWIGTGRDGGSHGEFMAIFYNTSRLAPLEYDHFWLSETPDKIGSRDESGEEGERAGSPRMVTWVRFQDQSTHAAFYALNTHLDNHSATARQHAATQITRYLTSGRLDPELPRIITGDFNVPAGRGTSVYDTMLTEGRLADSPHPASRPATPPSTPTAIRASTPATICRCRPSSHTCARALRNRG